MTRQILFAAMLTVFLLSCGGGGQKGPGDSPEAAKFAKNTPQPLTYETVSGIVKDMKSYSNAVKKLDQKVVQVTDKAYQGVLFEIEQKPLFINVYPDSAGSRIIFLLAPKDPTTGSNYVLTFDQKLPVINSESVELQVRSKNPDNPLTCTMTVPDPAAYMTEYPSHQLMARYQFSKKFLQSGTYDFDALDVPSYRTRGYAFIVFDLVKAEVVDQTANLTASCTQ